MKVEVGNFVQVGFAGKNYDPENHYETYKSTAQVWLRDGTVGVGCGIGAATCCFHPNHLEDHIPKTKPYDVALRITKDGNLPQIQFNDDSVWHNFAPEGGTALKAGPWFPYLALYSAAVRLVDHSVQRLGAVKSAGEGGVGGAFGQPADQGTTTLPDNIDHAKLVSAALNRPELVSAAVALAKQPTHDDAGMVTFCQAACKDADDDCQAACQAAYGLQHGSTEEESKPDDGGGTTPQDDGPDGWMSRMEEAGTLRSVCTVCLRLFAFN